MSVVSTLKPFIGHWTLVQWSHWLEMSLIRRFRKWWESEKSKSNLLLFYPMENYKKNRWKISFVCWFLYLIWSYDLNFVLNNFIAKRIWKRNDLCFISCLFGLNCNWDTNWENITKIVKSKSHWFLLVLLSFIQSSMWILPCSNKQFFRKNHEM